MSLFARVSKPFRRTAVASAAAAATAVSFSQMLFLKASYASPPDALGPREGVESMSCGMTTTNGTTVSLPVESADSPGGAAAAAASGSAASPARGVAGELDVSTEGSLDMVKSMAEVEAIVAKASLEADKQADASGDRPRKKPRILVIGDSLVSGVGGEASYTTGSRSGPPLPRHIAKSLSRKWNADVQWNVFSLTGGDVRMLRRKILPMLKRDRAEREKAPDVSSDIAAVVLVTGVNDWKRMSPMRTPSKFRSDLRDFIQSIRDEVGQNCHVFLPAIPGVHHAPRFHYPLRSFLIFINDMWDAQKLALARTVENVHFVGNPPEADWTTKPEQFFCTQDRLHPSELGYTRWGERIAVQIASATEKGRAALLNSRISGHLQAQSAAAAATFVGSNGAGTSAAADGLAAVAKRSSEASASSLS